MLAPAALLLATAASAEPPAVQQQRYPAPQHLWVDRGDLVQGGKRTHVGTKASDLQKLIDALPPAKPLANVTAIINSTQLRRLRLTGAYIGDQTLHLPSLFVLALDPGTTYRGSAAGLPDPRPCPSWQPPGLPCPPRPADGNSMIQLNGTYYSAIVGGHFDCADMPRTFHVRLYSTTTTTTADR